jgi:CheY-like chemotaxis protein
MARVLLVDDDRAGLAIRKLVLERSGHQVAIASNVEEAQALFREVQPETVVLDLRVPELEDGLKLIREFRAAAPNVRLVALAGLSADLDGRSEAGMVDEIVAKPSPTRRLLEAVEGRSTAR